MGVTLDEFLGLVGQALPRNLQKSVQQPGLAGGSFRLPIPEIDLAECL